MMNRGIIMGELEIVTNGDIVIKGLSSEEVLILENLFGIYPRIDGNLVNEYNEQYCQKVNFNGKNRTYSVYNNNTIEIQNI